MQTQITKGTILCHYTKTDYFLEMLHNAKIPVICINCGYYGEFDLIVFERRV